VVNILPFIPALQDAENILHGLLRGRSLEGGMRVTGGMKMPRSLYLKGLAPSDGRDGRIFEFLAKPSGRAERRI